MTTHLPASVAAALADPAPGERIRVEAAGIPFSALTWGSPTDRPLLLIHGVTSSAANWWRVGPALAASGRRVVAVDLPGHGLTGHWAGHVPFGDTAADVAAFARAAGLVRADLQVIGHSWGAMTAAALPVAGLRTATLVLLDPPFLPLALISAEASDPQQRTYDDLDEAKRDLAAANPGWHAGDVKVRAEALTQLDEAAARSVVLENGDWDGGLAALSDPTARGVPVWIVRGEQATGSYLPDAALPAFEALIGKGHTATIAGGPHSPQRTHPVETTAALLRALEA